MQACVFPLCSGNDLSCFFPGFPCVSPETGETKFRRIMISFEMTIPIPSITTISVFLGGVGTAVIAWLALQHHMTERRRKTRAANLFFSIQMNDLSEEEYRSVRKSVLEAVEVVEGAKSLKNVGHVYYFNRDVPSHENLDQQHFPIDEYMRELDRCDYFIAIISKRVHSSIYFEAGYALAKGKECILFSAKQEEVLPTIARYCCETYPSCQSIPFSDISDVVHKLRQMTPNFKLQHATKHAPIA